MNKAKPEFKIKKEVRVLKENFDKWISTSKSTGCVVLDQDSDGLTSSFLIGLHEVHKHFYPDSKIRIACIPTKFGSIIPTAEYRYLICPMLDNMEPTQEMIEFLESKGETNLENKNNIIYCIDENDNAIMGLA